MSKWTSGYKYFKDVFGNSSENSLELRSPDHPDGPKRITSQRLHGLILAGLFILYIILIFTAKFSKPKDYFTNIDKTKNKKNIEKFDTPTSSNEEDTDFINHGVFHYNIHNDGYNFLEVFTNVVGFILGITLSSFIKVFYLNHESSHRNTLNMGLFATLIIILFLMYFSALYQRGDPTKVWGRIAYFFYPLIGGLILLGDVLIVRMGDVYATNNGEDPRGELVETNRINKLMKAVGKIFPKLKVNETSFNEAELLPDQGTINELFGEIIMKSVEAAMKVRNLGHHHE
jgi:uncharacterized membrane protein